MMQLRLYDPIGLLSKEKELANIRQQILDLIDREQELRELKKCHSQPKQRKRVKEA
jgi:hypothetical protein